MTNNTRFSNFPARYLAQRPQFGQLFEQFKDADFDNYAEPTWDLRDALRSPVPAWQQQFNIANELRVQAPAEPLLLPEDSAGVDSNSPEAQAWQAWIAKAAKHVLHYPRLEEELDTFKALIYFQRAGSHIYSFTSSLLKKLSSNDVGSFRRGEIVLPYPSLYLHFGPQDDVELPLYLFAWKHDLSLENEEDGGTRYLLDGAFVQEDKRHALEITLTFCDPREDFSSRPSVTSDYRFPVVTLTLDFDGYRGGALERTLDESTAVFSDLWDTTGETGELKYGRMRELLMDDDFEFDSERDEYKLFNRAITLIANSLRSLNQPDTQVHADLTTHICGQDFAAVTPV